MSVQDLYNLATEALLRNGKFQLDAFCYEGKAEGIGEFRISTYYARFQPGWRKGSTKTQMTMLLANRRIVLAISSNAGLESFILACPRDLQAKGDSMSTHLASRLPKLPSGHSPDEVVAFSYSPPALIEDTDPRVEALCASLR